MCKAPVHHYVIGITPHPPSIPFHLNYIYIYIYIYTLYVYVIYIYIYIYIIQKGVGGPRENPLEFSRGPREPQRRGARTSEGSRKTQPMDTKRFIQIFEYSHVEKA